MNEDPIDASIIDLRVATLRQLFNEMDPSPLRERDLNPRTEEYIVGWCRELPRNAALCLHIHVDRSDEESSDPAIIGESIRHFFRGRSIATRLRLRRLFAHGRIALVIGLGCLAVAFGLSRLLEDFGPFGGFSGIVKESLVVGGWVAMWRPLEIFLYDWWPILADARLSDRLAGMSVRITCKNTEATPRATHP